MNSPETVNIDMNIHTHVNQWWGLASTVNTRPSVGGGAGGGHATAPL